MSIIHQCGGSIFHSLRALHGVSPEYHEYTFDQLRGIVPIHPFKEEETHELQQQSQGENKTKQEEEEKEESTSSSSPLSSPIPPPPPPPPVFPESSEEEEKKVEDTSDTKKNQRSSRTRKQTQPKKEEQKLTKKQKRGVKQLDNNDGGNVVLCNHCPVHCCTNCPTHCNQQPQKFPSPPLPSPQLPPQFPQPQQPFPPFPQQPPQQPFPPFPQQPPQQPFPSPFPQQPQQNPLPFPFPNPAPGNPFPRPIPLPNPPPSQPVPGQQLVTVKMPSAYYGDVPVECVDRGNGNYEMIGKTVPIQGKSLVIKCIDAQRNGITEQNLPTLMQVAQMPPIVLNLGEARRQQLIVASLRDKPNKNPQDMNTLKQAYTYLNVVDALFLTKEHMQFLYEFCGLTNVNNDNVNFLANVCNLPNVDNAFFTKYMVYGTGNRMFYPMCCIDVGSHELFHGVTDLINGLIYKGHSGAINEHISDAGSLFFERYMYNKYNENADKSDDILGSFDYTMGEDVGREMRILRSFSNPEQSPQPQPSIYRGMYWADPNSPADYGGVHTNSGVGNKLLYLVIQSAGFDKTGKAFFAAWKSLKPNANYIHYRDALKTAAIQFQIFPQMQQALNDVGLTDAAISDWYGA